MSQNVIINDEKVGNVAGLGLGCWMYCGEICLERDWGNARTYESG
jgi:hypothetical protein